MVVALSIEGGQALANPGGGVVLDYSGIVAPQPGDWVGMYDPAQPETDGVTAYWAPWTYLNGTNTHPGSAASAGSFVFPVPTTDWVAPGQVYEFRLFSNDTYTRLTKTAGTVTISLPTLAVAAGNKGVGTTIPVTLGNVQAPTAGDWIGLFHLGDGDQAAVDWVYASSTSNPATRVKGAARSSGVVQFKLPVGATPDSYEFRLFRNDGYSKLATSAPITVVRPGTPTLTLPTVTPAATYSQGQGLPVTWAGVSGPTAGDWIGLYHAGEPDANLLSWGYVSSGTLQKASGWTPVATGTVTFPLPGDLPDGEYEVRLFANDAFLFLAQAALVLARATVTVTQHAAHPGDSVTVTFAGVSPPTVEDRVALYAEGVTDMQDMAGPWVYTSSGTKTPGTTARKSGSFAYPLPTDPRPVPDGYYEMHLVGKSPGGLVAQTPPRSEFGGIAVTGLPASVTVTPSAGVQAGKPISVATYIPVNPAATDWVGLFRLGDADTAPPSAWAYIASGSQARPASPFVAATLSLTVPAGAVKDSYNVRAFHGDSPSAARTLIVKSNTFAVTPVPPVLLFAGPTSSAPSPWNVKATGYGVDPNSAKYIQNLASVMDVVKNAGQGAQNLVINGATPSYTTYGIPSYAMPIYFAGSGVVPVRVTARREYQSGGPWWGPETLTSPAGQGFSAVPLLSTWKPDHGYGSCDTDYGPPCAAHYGRYDPEVSPAMPLFPAGGWPQWQTGDHHLIVVSQSLNAVWEFWKMGYNVPDPNDPSHVPIDGWSASGAVKWALNGPGYGPVAPGMGSARAYGGSAAAGAITKKEMDAGVIPHALAFAYSYTDGIYYAAGRNATLNGPMCVATHTDGYCPTKGGVPFRTKNNAGPGRVGGEANGWSLPEGARLRLRQAVSVDARATAWESAHPGRGAAVRILGTALQQYGMYVVDHSGLIYDAANPTTEVPTANLYAEHVFGLPNQTWGGSLHSDDARAFPSSDFEVLALPTLTLLCPNKCGIACP